MRTRLLLSFLACILALISFYSLSKAVQRGYFQKLDFDTTVRLQGKIPLIERLGGDELWEDISFFVSPPLSVIWVLVLTGTAGFATLKTRKKDRHRAVLLGFTTLAIPTLFTMLIGLEVYGKDVIRQQPPPHFMLKNPTTIFPKFYVSEEFSYPSGHAGRAAFLSVVTAGFVAHQTQKGPKNKRFLIASIGLALYSLLVSIGKIYLGHHWLSDILAGWVLGGGLGLSIVFFTQPVIRGRTIDTQKKVE